jgi:hypothetical protein
MRSKPPRDELFTFGAIAMSQMPSAPHSMEQEVTVDRDSTRCRTMTLSPLSARDGVRIQGWEWAWAWIMALVRGWVWVMDKGERTTMGCYVGGVLRYADPSIGLRRFSVVLIPISRTSLVSGISVRPVHRLLTCNIVWCVMIICLVQCLNN